MTTCCMAAFSLHSRASFAPGSREARKAHQGRRDLSGLPVTQYSSERPFAIWGASPLELLVAFDSCAGFIEELLPPAPAKNPRKTSRFCRLLLSTRGVRFVSFLYFIVYS